MNRKKKFIKKCILFILIGFAIMFCTIIRIGTYTFYNEEPNKFSEVKINNKIDGNVKAYLYIDNYYRLYNVKTGYMARKIYNIYIVDEDGKYYIVKTYKNNNSDKLNYSKKVGVVRKINKSMKEKIINEYKKITNINNVELNDDNFQEIIGDSYLDLSSTFINNDNKFMYISIIALSIGVLMIMLSIILIIKTKKDIKKKENIII